MHTAQCLNSHLPHGNSMLTTIFLSPSSEMIRLQAELSERRERDLYSGGWLFFFSNLTPFSLSVFINFINLHVYYYLVFFWEGESFLAGCLLEK